MRGAGGVFLGFFFRAALAFAKNLALHRDLDMKSLAWSGPLVRAGGSAGRALAALREPFLQAALGLSPLSSSARSSSKSRTSAGRCRGGR